MLVSSVDDVGMVHAFEGLVGSHGGLGGAQNEAVLVHPAHLALPDGELEDVDGERLLVGAEAVHRRLVAWLEDLGVRPRTGMRGDTGSRGDEVRGTAEGRAGGTRRGGAP